MHNSAVNFPIELIYTYIYTAYFIWICNCKYIKKFAFISDVGEQIVQATIWPIAFLNHFSINCMLTVFLVLIADFSLGFQHKGFKNRSSSNSRNKCTIELTNTLWHKKCSRNIYADNILWLSSSFERGEWRVCKCFNNDI